MDSEWVILDAAHFTVTKLNEVGGLIWELLKQEASMEMIVDKLVETYDVSRQHALADALTFMEQLAHIGVVMRAS